MRAIAILLCTVFMSQTVAFAMDPVQASMNSERAQLEAARTADQIKSRYEKLSDSKKLKYLTRQEKRVKKFENSIAKMSDKKFEKIRNKLEVMESDADDLTLSAEEKAVYVGNENAKVSEADAKAISQTVRSLNKESLLGKIKEMLTQIELEKNDVLNRMAGIETKKSASRAVASGFTCPDMTYGIIAIASFVMVILVILTPLVMIPMIILGASISTFIVCAIFGTQGAPTYEW